MANFKPSLNLRTGPAGWLHPHWTGVIYPKTAPKGFHPLEFLAQRFDTVEINTNAHQPLRPELSHMWLDKVRRNPNFAFTARLAREFTHERQLDPAAITNFRDGLRPLQKAGKLGCLFLRKEGCDARPGSQIARRRPENAPLALLTPFMPTARVAFRQACWP